jgi:hypothetical protein
VYQVIQLHFDAPAKPAEGDACNGCGVCCASEPCPIGALISRRLHGECAALEWSDDSGVYRCGVARNPDKHLPAALRWLAPTLARLTLRFISAGSGCDCSMTVESR